MAEIKLEPVKRGGAARWLVPLLLLLLLAALAYWWFVMRAGVPVDGVNDTTDVVPPSSSRLHVPAERAPAWAAATWPLPTLT